jgi:hypothetical protein
MFKHIIIARRCSIPTTHTHEPEVSWVVVHLYTTMTTKLLESKGSCCAWASVQQSVNPTRNKGPRVSFQPGQSIVAERSHAVGQSHDIWTEQNRYVSRPIDNCQEVGNRYSISPLAVARALYLEAFDIYSPLTRLHNAVCSATQNHHLHDCTSNSDNAPCLHMTITNDPYIYRSRTTKTFDYVI